MRAFPAVSQFGSPTSTHLRPHHATCQPRSHRGPRPRGTPADLAMAPSPHRNHAEATMGQAEAERKLQYQWNYRRGDLPPQAPPNHYTVHLHRPYTPGVGLAPPARVNIEGLSYDWQTSLALMHTTSSCLHAKCERELQQLEPHIAPQDTVALRRAANSSLEAQMRHFTSCMAVWAGASAPERPQQPAEPVGQ